MPFSRRALLGASAAALLARPALAQGWPAERAIRLIVPVAPGGSQDVVARLYARCEPSLIFRNSATRFPNHKSFQKW